MISAAVTPCTPRRRWRYAEAYRHSYQARLVALSFGDDATAQEEAMNAARAAQAINYDAICGQIDLMVKRGAAAKEWAAFASGLAEDLKFHPLPMHDLIKEIDLSHRKQVPGGTGDPAWMRCKKPLR